MLIAHYTTDKVMTKILWLLHKHDTTDELAHFIHFIYTYPHFIHVSTPISPKHIYNLKNHPLYPMYHMCTYVS